MRYHSRLPVLLPALALLSCGGDGDSNNTPASAELGREYLIGYGETIEVDSLSLEFSTLAEESRCPASAICVWEGNARILLTLVKGRTTAVVELNSSSRFQTFAVFEGYYVSLRNLAPYPATPSTPLPQNYTATVFVDGHVAPASN